MESSRPEGAHPEGSGAPEEQRERHGTDSDMFVPFVVYTALTLAGLVTAIVIGLTHG